MESKRVFSWLTYQLQLPVGSGEPSFVVDLQLGWSSGSCSSDQGLWWFGNKLEYEEAVFFSCVYLQMSLLIYAYICNIYIYMVITNIPLSLVLTTNTGSWWFLWELFLGVQRPDQKIFRWFCNSKVFGLVWCVCLSVYLSSCPAV